ncbi:unnamed protein product [Ambrosiozyma monospora]|uniref:Unnamed protein product n=1 Tax=Ambrosiozyma monospora TaxID=43982 RepID=A0ACB5SW82_AMBMO|nr:unnamed protein product [Ambrosiozyma monospora]
MGAMDTDTEDDSNSDSEDGMDIDDPNFVPESRGRHANNGAYRTGSLKPKPSEVDDLRREQEEYDRGLLNAPTRRVL